MILGITCLSCSKEQHKNAYFPDEKFVDSLNIGFKGMNKVEIEKFRNDSTEDHLVILNFYKKDSIRDFKDQKNMGYRWEQVNRFYFEKDGLTGIDSEIEDFNNDGFKDLTYRSGIAGRGGNTIRTLFIFNPMDKSFVHVKNSDNYPNLSYNPKLNCINSLILTGSTITSYLTIKKDSLFEFARVDVSDKIVVEERDSLGKFHVIEEKKFNGNDKDFYIPFMNYKPLEY